MVLPWGSRPFLGQCTIPEAQLPKVFPPKFRGLILVEHTTRAITVEITPTKMYFPHIEIVEIKGRVFTKICASESKEIWPNITTHGVSSVQTIPWLALKSDKSNICHHSMDYPRVSSVLNHSGTSLYLLSMDWLKGKPKRLSHEIWSFL